MNIQKKILIIDCDQKFGNKIKKYLIQHQYNVCYESDSTSGIKKSFDYHPDLILCDMNMVPIDGCQVFKVLKDSLLLKNIPFIFFKQNASFEDVRQGMNLGADDFLSKPINLHDLLTSIEIQLQKYKSNLNELTHEFNTLFQLSPNGIIVFSENTVLRSNRPFKTLLKIDNQESKIRIETLFESSSLLKIKSWIQNSYKGINSVFNENISIKDSKGEEVYLNMIISEFANYDDSIQFIGFFTPVSPVNNHWISDDLANEVCDLLKREKITFIDNLEERISSVLKNRTLSYNNENNSFFTKRENQVLCLSMEGLPIKNIADRLAISSRTVEKYRTKLMEKSNAKNIVEVIIFSLKKGLIKI